MRNEVGRGPVESEAKQIYRTAEKEMMDSQFSLINAAMEEWIKAWFLLKRCIESHLNQGDLRWSRWLPSPQMQTDRSFILSINQSINQCRLFSFSCLSLSPPKWGHNANVLQEFEKVKYLWNNERELPWKSPKGMKSLSARLEEWPWKEHRANLLSENSFLALSPARSNT